MDFLSLRRTAGVAAIVVAALSAMPVAAVAKDRDYDDFRALAASIRLVDYITASSAYHRGDDLVDDGYAYARTYQPWRDAYDKAFPWRIQGSQEALTDAVMRAAFASFTHDEIKRLKVLCAKPVVYRFQSSMIKAFGKDAKMGPGEFLDDPDLKTLSADERRLFERIVLVAVDWEKTPAIDIYKAIERKTEQDASEAAPPPIQAPPVPRTTSSAPSSPPAVASVSGVPDDAATFGAILVRSRFVDFLSAVQSQAVIDGGDYGGNSDTWQVTFLGAVDRGVHEKADALVAIAVKANAATLSHADIQKLDRLSRLPGAAKMFGLIIDQMRAGKAADLTPLGKDKDYLALSADDRLMLSKVLAATKPAIDSDIFYGVIKAAEDEATSSDPTHEPAWHGPAPSNDEPAPEKDYPVFRAVGESMRIVDQMEATQYFNTMKPAGSAAWMTPAQKKVLVDSTHRKLADKHAVVLDAIMHPAFNAFSHADVVRLKALSARPFFTRYANAEVAAIRDGGNTADMFKMRKTDPDGMTWSEADIALLHRLVTEARAAATGAIDSAIMPILEDALRDVFNATEAAGGTPALASDYGDFRALAGPSRVVDMVSSLTTRGMGAVDRDGYYLRFSEAHMTAYIAATERGIHQRAEAVIDLVMRPSLASFSHEEVERLNVIYTQPGMARFQAAVVKAIGTRGDFAAAMAEARRLPGYTSLSPSDRDVLDRFLSVLATNLGLAKPAIKTALEAADAETKGIR